MISQNEFIYIKIEKMHRLFVCIFSWWIVRMFLCRGTRFSHLSGPPPVFSVVFIREIVQGGQGCKIDSGSEPSSDNSQHFGVWTGELIITGRGETNWSMTGLSFSSDRCLGGYTSSIWVIEAVLQTWIGSQKDWWFLIKIINWIWRHVLKYRESFKLK